MKNARLTAKEAKEMTEHSTSANKYWGNSDERQLTEILDMIVTCTAIGEYHLKYFNVIRTPVYNELVELGYNITSTRDITHTMYDIKWEG